MTNHSIYHGSLEVICGPMFSGKTEELIRRLRRAKIAKQHIIAFKHSSDKQVTIEKITSHNGNTITAWPTQKIEEIRLHSLIESVNVVGIDEVQFFENSIIELVCQLIDAGKQVIIAGLDLDFRGLPFGPMATLLAIADDITKLKAICTQCGLDAHFSQRLVDNLPAKYHDPLIQVGAQESYQARCRRCYSIDQQPHFSV